MGGLVTPPEPIGGEDGPVAPEPDWTYIASMVPTRGNDADFKMRGFNNEPLVVVFDDPVEASAHAMKSGWYPFMVERYPKG